MAGRAIRPAASSPCWCWRSSRRGIKRSLPQATPPASVAMVFESGGKTPPSIANPAPVAPNRQASPAPQPSAPSPPPPAPPVEQPAPQRRNSHQPIRRTPPTAGATRATDQRRVRRRPKRRPRPRSSAPAPPAAPPVQETAPPAAGDRPDARANRHRAGAGAAGHAAEPRRKSARRRAPAPAAQAPAPEAVPLAAAAAHAGTAASPAARHAAPAPAAGGEPGRQPRHAPGRPSRRRWISPWDRASPCRKPPRRDRTRRTEPSICRSHR